MDYQKLFVLLPKSHTKWTVDDIAIWLQFIGLEALIPGFSNISRLFQRRQPSTEVA